MSSSTPIRSPERDQQMLAVGRECSHPSCLLVDFLPFKCQHCANSFCADHFKPASHSCSKYDEFKYDRVAPDCGHFSLAVYPKSLIVSRSSLQRTCCHSSGRGSKHKDGTPPQRGLLRHDWSVTEGQLGTKVRKAQVWENFVRTDTV